MSHLTRRRLLLAASGGVALVPGLARAQAAAAGFPQRPVRIVVPTPPGGASDTSARLLAQALAPQWSQQVVVENRPGASGALAAQAVLQAPAADAHTLLWGLSSMAGLPFVLKSPPFRDLAEFVPVAPVVQFGYALFVSNEVPARSFAELVAHGRAQPGRLSYATGTLSEYLVGAHVLKQAGVQAVRVPYKGGAQLMPDLISGQVQLNFAPILGGLPHIRSGRLRALAVLGAQRHVLLPEVPALPELGIAPSPLPTWNALFAPPRTPADTAERVAQAAAQALRDPALRTGLEQQGADPLAGGPAQLADAVQAATRAWQAQVRDFAIDKE